MKIVHLCDYFQPKLGYQEYFLAREHARAGHEVHVVTSDRYFPFPDYDATVKGVLGERIVGEGCSSEEGIRVHRLPVLFEYPKKVWIKELGKELEGIDPDIIICHGIFNYSAIRLSGLKRALRAKLVYDDHSRNCLLRKDMPGIMAGRIFKKFFSSGINKSADLVVAVSEETAGIIVGRYGIDRRKIQVVPLGVDSAAFIRDERRGAEVRRSLGVSVDTLLIIYSGKITSEKYPHLILDSLASMAGGHPEVAALFVGNIERSYEKEFLGRVASCAYRVFMHRAVPGKDLSGFFSAADIAVWPAHSTISIVEALSCGLPTIYPDSHKELNKWNCGFCMRQGNLSDLTNALEKLITDPALREGMSKKARRIAEKELDWKVLAEKFIP